MFRLREGVGIATNNVAEYRGAILGLKYALQKGFKHIRVQGDSKLVCMQVLLISIAFHLILFISFILWTEVFIRRWGIIPSEKFFPSFSSDAGRSSDY